MNKMTIKMMKKMLKKQKKKKKLKKKQKKKQKKNQQLEGSWITLVRMENIYTRGSIMRRM